MKNIKFMLVIFLATGLFVACNGNHPANHNKDTMNKNPYNTPPAVQKPDSTNGDTVKDTTKK